MVMVQSTSAILLSIVTLSVSNVTLLALQSFVLSGDVSSSSSRAVVRLVSSGDELRKEKKDFIILPSRRDDNPNY